MCSESHVSFKTSVGILAEITFRKTQHIEITHDTHWYSHLMHTILILHLIQI